MSYTKKERRKWKEFGSALALAGIDKNSFRGVDDLFDDYDEYLRWEKGKEARKDEKLAV